MKRGKEAGTSKGVGKGKGTAVAIRSAGEDLKQTAEEIGGCYIGRLWSRSRSRDLSLRRLATTV